MTSISIRNFRGGCVLAATLTMAVLGATASAQTPKPAPCDGKLLIKDAAGDQSASQQGVPVFATPANTDVLGLFFRVDGDVVTANIVISDLTTSPMSGFSATRYRAYGTSGGEVHYFQALVGSGGATYSYGGQNEVTYTQQGDTKGALFEGKEGIVQIVIPPDVGGKPGTKLTATSATAGLLTAPVPPEAMLPPFYWQADTAPDASADGPATTPAPCESAAAPAVPASVKLQTTSLSSKKVNKSRSATLTLNSSEAMTAVTGKLKRGSTILGSGKLDSLSGTGKLKIKLKQKVKKGSYMVSVTAKRADGTPFSAALKLKVKA